MACICSIARMRTPSSGSGAVPAGSGSVIGSSWGLESARAPRGEARGGYMELRGLGYVGVNAPDPAEWARFATGVCGLMLAPSVPGKPGAEPGFGADGSAYLKLDARRWRVAVHRGAPGLAYLGLEVATLPALDSALDELVRRGIAVRRGSDAELEARAVGGLAVLTDPAGQRVELFASPGLDHGFRSPAGAEFRTAGGLGHAVLVVPDVEAQLSFYREVLGFARSDF